MLEHSISFDKPYNKSCPTWPFFYIGKKEFDDVILFYKNLSLDFLCNEMT